MTERLKKLQSQKRQFPTFRELSRYLNKHPELVKEIEELSLYFLKRRVSGCSNCYTDAYLELVNLPVQKKLENKNKKYGKENK